MFARSCHRPPLSDKILKRRENTVHDGLGPGATGCRCFSLKRQGKRQGRLQLERIPILPIHKLTPSKIAALIRDKHTGRASDGGNLYLDMQDGTGQWLFRYERVGVQHYISFGPQRTVPIETARAAALTARQDLRAGRDPKATREAKRLAEQREAAKQISFKDYSEIYIQDHASNWANGTSEDQWRNSLANHCWPVFGKVMIADVDTAFIVQALRPIWHRKPETATRLRGRIERILAAATVAGLRPEAPNPARWKNHLDQLLPARRKNGRKGARTHYPALPYDQIGEFVADLRAREGVAARALEFVILCASRTGDINGQAANEDRPPMRWADVNFDEALWTIPATKTGGEHIVPLSPAALAVLRKVQALKLHPELVFPSLDRPGQPLSHFALSAVIARMNRERVAQGQQRYIDPKQQNRPATVHGMRSAFRSWAAARSNFPREVAESALAHTVGNKIEAAYQRDDLFKKRKRLMDAWAGFIAKPAAASGKVVSLR
jgi:integrase